VACIPTKPDISALWQSGTYLGTTAPAYNSSGYGVQAMATSPSGANLYYVFEWSSDPNPASKSSDWTGSGGWAGVTHYTDYNPGTYYASAWAVDQYGNWSASPSDWLPITLTTTAPTVSCSGAPGNPFIGQSVRWTPVVSGGSRSYSYSWSGDEGLSGSTASVTKTYTTTGVKNATLVVTDTRSLQTASASCSTGGNQLNGPTNGGASGTGVGVGTCTASLFASPDTIEQGDNTTFTWGVTGGSLCASSCSGSGFNTGGATSGTAAASVIPVPPTTPPYVINYGLTCEGGTYGPPLPPTVYTPVTILVPTVTFTVNGQSVTARVNPSTTGNANVVWSSTNSSFCSVTKNGAIPAWKTGLSSTGTSDTVTTQTTYKVVCKNNHGTQATASVTVNVLANFNEF
jgi:hypothetical protein